MNMKVITVYDKKDIDNTGEVGSVKIYGVTKKLFRFIFNSDSKYFDEFPNSIFTLLYYKNDTFSDVLISVDEFKECEVYKNYNNGVYDIAFKTKSSYNTDEMNKIRSSRINSFLQDDNEDLG